MMARNSLHGTCAILILLLSSLAFNVHAQDAADRIEWAAGSGDGWIDARLADINLYAARHRDAFTDEIVRYHAAPRVLVEQLLDDERWMPGDVYFACALAHVIGRNCREIADLRAERFDAPWSGVVERIEADAPLRPLPAIRRGIAASYERWARPLDVGAQGKR